MTINSAVLLLIGVLVIILVAWALDYIATQKLTLPQPASLIIWGIAFLGVLLLLLQAVGVLTVVDAIQPAFTAFG